MADADGSEAAKQQLQRIADYKEVFGTDAGKRVLRDIEDFAQLLSDGFDENPHVTSYNAGRRSVGVYILRMLEMSREDLQEAIRKQAIEED